MAVVARAAGVPPGTGRDDTLYGTAAAETIEGLGGFDTIEGRGGNDVLRGGGGWNRLNGGAGDDIIYGGDEGNSITDSWGSDKIYGGAGDDFVVLYRWASASSGTVEVQTGGGADTLLFAGSRKLRLTADLGAGDDEISLTRVAGPARLTLGEGRDTVELGWFGIRPGANVVVTDFEAGAGGDRFVFEDMLTENLPDWDQSTNPFATGYLRIMQSDADTLLQIDRDGGGDSYSTAVTLRNVDASALQAYNLNDYPADGTAEPGRMIVDHGDEQVVGGGGNDRIEGYGDFVDILGQAGSDTLIAHSRISFLNGGLGDDRVHGGEGEDHISSWSGSDRIWGNDGDDRISVSRIGGPGGDRVEIAAGAGNDEVGIDTSVRTTAVIDLGAGNDIFSLGPVLGTVRLTLGAGRDEIDASGGWGEQLGSASAIRVGDFVAGAGGDVFDLSELAESGLSGAEDVLNPFSSGHLRLLQSGADTLLQVDRDGGGDGYKTLITLTGVTASDLIAANLGGFRPDGRAPAGRTITAAGDYQDVEGGAGDDVINGSETHDNLSGRGGSDHIMGGGGFDYINGGAGDDVLEGGAYADSLTDRGGSDIMSGGEGDDRLTVVRDAGDRLDDVLVEGGAGADELQFLGLGAVNLRAILGGGHDVVSLGSGGGTAHVWLGAGRDKIQVSHSGSGDAPAVVVKDFVAGSDGDFLAWEGTLSALAPTWNHRDNPYEAGFARIGQRGADTVIQIDPSGRGLDYTTLLILENVDARTLTVANFEHFMPTEIVRLPTEGTDRIAGTDSADRMEGLGGDDRLSGLGGEDRIDGNEGNDIINGGAGADAMVGGVGNDRYRVDNAGDSIVEAAGGGLDRVLASINYTLAEDVETLQLTGAARSGVGNALDNKVSGTGGDNLLDGLDGADRIMGLDGDDGLKGGEGADLLVGGAGDDALRGGNGGDRLLGQDGRDHVSGLGGDDRVFGGANSDVIAGGDGDDVLSGGAGEDHLQGGAGADRFLFDDGDCGGIRGTSDTIVLFNRSSGDVIDVSLIDADEGAPGDQNFTYIGTTAFSGVAGELRAYLDPRDSRMFVAGDTDGDAVADFYIGIFDQEPLTEQHLVL